jgi:hypothetical protein
MNNGDSPRNSYVGKREKIPKSSDKINKFNNIRQQDIF